METLGPVGAAVEGRRNYAAKLSFIIILLFDAKILIDIFVLVEIIIILLSINIINRISSIICLKKRLD